MIQWSGKKILIAFVVILVASRTRRILEFLRGLDFGGILTLEPLHRQPEEGRFLVTIALCALVFAFLVFLLSRRK
jgi:hypothetical protein